MAGTLESRRQSKRLNSNHLKISECEFRIVNHSFTPAWKCWSGMKKLRSETMSAPTTKAVEASIALQPSCSKSAAHALTIVRDGVITGEGPTTKGRIHFSRTLDADDAAWCARILTASAVEHQPVSRAEADA